MALRNLRTGSAKRRLKAGALSFAWQVADRTPPRLGPARLRRINARVRIAQALRLVREAQNYALAEATVHPLIETEHSGRAWYVVAVSRQKQQDVSGALSAVRRATQAEPNNVDLILMHRQLALKTGYSEEAKELLDRLARRKPKSVKDVRQTMEALAEGADADLVAQYDRTLQSSGIGYQPERLSELEEQLRLAELYRCDRDAFRQRVESLGERRERPAHIVSRTLFACEAWDELAALLEENGGSELLTARQIRRAANKALSKGRTSSAVAFARRALIADRADEKMSEIVANGCDQLAVAQDGWPALLSGSPVAHMQKERAVLSVLAQSLPVTSGGYATRSHGILSGLVARSWDVRAVTKLGFPLDWWRGIGTREVTELDVVEGIPYHRLYDDGVREYPQYPLSVYTSRFADRITKHARDHGANLIHASSFYVNGLAGAIAARRLGIPFLYEMRGLEDLMKISRDPSFAETDRYRFLTTVENAACRDADVVFTITDALRREMIERGVPEGRLVVLPNGVHVDKFSPRERDAELAVELGLSDKTVIGYAGGLVDYEGLDLLLKAAAALKVRRSDFHVLILGDGHHEHVLRGMAEALHLGDVVTFAGRVPHAQVGRYISLFDIAPFPRLPLPVCELISPIKPFESMAMGKAVVSSSVAALTEIVDHGKTGLVFEKGSADDLAAVLEQLIESPDQRAKLGQAAREWVVAERDWSKIVSIVDETYQRVLGSSTAG